MMIGMGLMVLFWAGLIALVVWLVRVLFPPAGQRWLQPPGGDQDPARILDRRYARGEISREEYDLMKETLSLHRE